MADIRTIWESEKSQGDWLLANGSLASDADLETAVTLSLFTDARAGDDDVLPDDGSDRRGWWGDLDGSEIHGIAKVGSRLWLRTREKATEETRRKIENDIREALQWLLDDGVVASIDLASEWQEGGRIAIALVLWRRSAAPLTLKYDNVWAQLS